MGCDFFTNLDGVFEAEFRDYKTGQTVAVVKFRIPNPETADLDSKRGHPIGFDVLEGDER